MHRDEDLATIATFYRRVQWSALALGLLWVVWLLAPILSPFVIAAILGWLGDPMVDRLEARRISRNTAVILVFGAMAVVLLVVAVLLIPVLEDQVMILVNSLPGYRDWFVGTALPWVEHRTGLQILSWLDPERLFVLIREHWQSAGGAASAVLGYVSRSGFALLGWLANIVLLPVLSFFFLRDWDLIVGRIGLLVPRDHFDTVRRLALESNEVLGGFLR
ncbi:MAG TPA: AI-2E family transporter, partial [Thermomonas sp.]|nr:AI-2E family transporter [Thermomonas sp.]